MQIYDMEKAEKEKAYIFIFFSCIIFYPANVSSNWSSTVALRIMCLPLCSQAPMISLDKTSLCRYSHNFLRYIEKIDIKFAKIVEI